MNKTAWAMLQAAVGIWAVINLEMCGIGMTEAPKTKPILRIEYIFPGYQAGLWLGTRTAK